MRNIRLLLAAALCLLGSAKGLAQVTSHAELSNQKLYVVTTPRGAWWVDQANSRMHYNASATAASDIPTGDINYQFAFITHEGHTYLYAPAVKQFVQPQKYFVTGYSTPVTYTGTVVKAENSPLTINIGGSQWTWDTWTGADDGNTVSIIEYANFSEDDLNEAISILTGTAHFDQHKAYTITCARLQWAASADHNSLSSVTSNPSATDADKQFAFFYEDGKLYIYSVGAGKFLKADGTLATGTLGDPMDYRIIGTSGYDHMLLIPSLHYYFNAQDAGGYAINYYSTPDDGNKQAIVEVAGVDVYDEMYEIVHPSYFVTYVVKDEAGNTLYTTDPLGTTLGTHITELPSDLRRPYYSYSSADVTISEKNTTVEFTATWEGPFEISADYASAHWYDLAMRGTWYVTSAIKDGDGAYKTQNANTMGLVEESYHWAFLGNGYDGFRLINKEAGEGKSFGYTDAARTNAGIPTVLADGEGTHVWTVAPSTSTIANSFTLNVPGTNLYINQYGGAGGSLKFWNSANNVSDGGSAFTVMEIPDDFSSFVADEIAPYFEVSGDIFVLTDAAKAAVGYDEAYKTNCPFATYKAMKEALQTVLADPASFTYPADGYYRMVSPLYEGYTLSYADNAGTASTSSLTGAEKATTSVVKLTALGEGKYSIALQGHYVGAPEKSAWIALSETPVEFTAVPSGLGYSAFTTGEDFGAIHCANTQEYHNVGWTADAAASQWVVEPATEVEIAVSAAGYATTYLPFDVTAPAKVTAYIGTVDGAGSAQWLTLQDIGKVIPEGTPVILKADAATYTFTIGVREKAEGDLDVFEDTVDGGEALAKALAPELESNALSGTYVPLEAAGKYVLAQPEGEDVCFYMATEGNIPAGKAYLEIASDVKAFFFHFGDDTTGVEMVDAEGAAEGNGLLFNLAGQRVNKAQKGIFIMNGKKVLK